jgi:hypothetical protein
MSLNPDKLSNRYGTKWHNYKMWRYANVKNEPISLFLIILFLLCFSAGAFAELAYIDPATNQSVLDQVVQKFGQS